MLAVGGEVVGRAFLHWNAVLCFLTSIVLLLLSLINWAIFPCVTDPKFYYISLKQLLSISLTTGVKILCMRKRLQKKKKLKMQQEMKKALKKTEAEQTATVETPRYKF